MLLDNEALYDNCFRTLKLTTPTCCDFNHDSIRGGSRRVLSAVVSSDVLVAGVTCKTTFKTIVQKSLAGLVKVLPNATSLTLVVLSHQRDVLRGRDRSRIL